MLLAAVGLVGLLASCGPNSTLQITIKDANPWLTYEKAPELKLKDITSFTTNHTLSADVKDSNTGRTISKGSYVICDNMNTQLSVGLTWQGKLSELYAQFQGMNTGEVLNKTVPNYKIAYPTAGKGTAEFQIGAGMAPLGITVNPVTVVKVLGETTVALQGVDENGYASNAIAAVNAIPVMECR